MPTGLLFMINSALLSNSNSETLNFVHFLCSSLISSPLAVVELKAHRSQCQSFEYPGLPEAVVDLKVKDRPSWNSFCWRLRLAGKYCVTEHARTQESLASGQTT